MSSLPPGPRSATLQTVAFARDPFAAPFDQPRWSTVAVLPDLQPGPAADTGAEAAASEGLPIDAQALAVLRALDEVHPRLLKNVEIEAATDLSKQTVGHVVKTLIARGLAERPEGERKGTTRTHAGKELLSRFP